MNKKLKQKREYKGCIHCIHLKTVTLHEGNVDKFSFAYIPVVRKRIARCGSVQIYYCKKQMINRIYVSETATRRLLYKNCPYYNKDEEEIVSLQILQDMMRKKKGIYK